MSKPGLSLNLGRRWCDHGENDPTTQKLDHVRYRRPNVAFSNNFFSSFIAVSSSLRSFDSHAALTIATLRGGSENFADRPRSHFPTPYFLPGPQLRRRSSTYSWIQDSRVLGTPSHGRKEWQNYIGLLPGPGFAVDIDRQVIGIMHKRGDGLLEVVDQDIKKETHPRLKSVR